MLLLFTVTRKLRSSVHKSGVIITNERGVSHKKNEVMDGRVFVAERMMAAFLPSLTENKINV